METQAEAERWAADEAYRRIRVRLPGRDFDYYFGPSHPDRE